MPKVSVIIPIYGVEKYIERCARSLFEQTLDDIEFIFIDDCSPDKSVEILKTILDEYKQIINTRKWAISIEKMPINSGLPAVRKYGVKMANGEYIVHCDSDDWIDSRMLNKMYQKGKEYNADIVVCDYFKSDGNNKLELCRF